MFFLLSFIWEVRIITLRGWNLLSIVWCLLYSRDGDNKSKLQFRFHVLATRYDHFMKAKILEENKLGILHVICDLTVPRKPRTPRQSLSSNSVPNSTPQYTHKSQCTHLQLLTKRSSPKTNNSYPNILWHFYIRKLHGTGTISWATLLNSNQDDLLTRETSTGFSLTN